MPDIPVLIAIAAMLTVIAVMSLLPGDARLLQLLSPGMHRAGHFGCYVLLAGLIALALKQESQYLSALAAFLLAATFGIAMEFLQRTRPGRSPSPVDALTNTAGAAIGALVVLAVM